MLTLYLRRAVSTPSWPGLRVVRRGPAEILLQRLANRSWILSQRQHGGDGDRLAVEKIKNAKRKSPGDQITILAVRLPAGFGRALDRRHRRVGAAEKRRAQPRRDGHIFGDHRGEITLGPRADDQPGPFHDAASRRLTSSQGLPSAGFATYSA